MASNNRVQDCYSYAFNINMIFIIILLILLRIGTKV